MNKFIISIIIIILALSPISSANAAKNELIADKIIDFSAKTMYYTTKYTLKTSWFITKIVAKAGIKITKSLFSGINSVFTEPKKNFPKIKNKPPSVNKTIELPPPPTIY